MQDIAEEEKYWLWLASVEGIGPVRFYHVLNTFTDIKSAWENCTEITRCVKGKMCIRDSYTRVRERYDSLLVQREDLVKAGGDLQVVIDNLLSGMKESFRAKFALINENFTNTFRDLFGGGHAELVLEDGDIMECGVEIIACLLYTSKRGGV